MKNTEKTRTYQEAVDMVVKFWMKNTFGVFYENDIPDSEDEWFNSTIFEKFSFDERGKVARGKRLGVTKKMMQDFEYILTSYLNMFEGKGQKTNELYMDYHPNPLLESYCKIVKINTLLLPKKAHTYITEKNEVYLRLGHYIGDAVPV